MQLSIDAIRTDGGTQPRAELNLFTVDEYAEAMQAGAQFPPVVVFFDGTEYWLADGYHRLHAAKQAGCAEIVADVRQGTRRDAVLYSVGANSSHGLRRTNADKRRAVLTLLHDSEWAQWSDREIARRCAVSHEFVRLQRASLSTVDSDSRSYMTKHGTAASMNTAKIGATAKIAPEVREAIRHTPVSENRDDLLKLARLEYSEQQAVAAKIAAGEAERVTDALKEIKRQERVERVQEISEGNRPLEGLGKFPVVYADPPWRYEFSADDADAIESHYPSMSLEDICALPVSDMATDDAVLFLWGTSPKLPEALQVIEAWGFQYVTCMVWVKDKIGLGYYARQQHELLLIAKRGQLPTPRPEDRPASVLTAPRGEHSAKPDEAYALIERMYPEYRRVELFARRRREGWDAWGNQA